MPLKYACFISYRHGTGFAERIVNELHDALRDQLQLRVTTPGDIIAIDRDRLKGGMFYNPALASALCESACMVVVFTPTYFDPKNTYCAREYKAMELLECERLKSVGKEDDRFNGLIIPIVFCGWKRLPKEIKNRRQSYRFDKFRTYNKHLGKISLYSEQIIEIAEYIADRYDQLNHLGSDPCASCDTFALPDEVEIRPWLETIVSPPMPFPLRGEDE